MTSVWIVWNYDWADADLTIKATFRTEDEARAYSLEHSGHGYGITEVELPADARRQGYVDGVARGIEMMGGAAVDAAEVQSRRHMWCHPPCSDCGGTPDA